ncbi:hypothetical protein [Priestia aryabhattai]|uniref:hypothetical protein n=1 Tax=Priestia aryabhattai TaxID=412384 RepID=UPI000BFBF69A|nr:hypothetical protein [Priestia aryabhattai]PHF72226.1 hypothetical protein COI42_17135 [Priestia aryabhattai]
MNKKMASYIIFFSWFLFLFLLWIVISLFKGENGQWWSMYRLNPNKYGPWALEVSYLKFWIAAVISLVIASIMHFGSKRHK